MVVGIIRLWVIRDRLNVCMHLCVCVFPPMPDRWMMFFFCFLASFLLPVLNEYDNLQLTKITFLIGGLCHSPELDVYLIFVFFQSHRIEKLFLYRAAIQLGDVHYDWIKSTHILRCSWSALPLWLGVEHEFLNRLIKFWLGNQVFRHAQCTVAKCESYGIKCRGCWYCRPGHWWGFCSSK